MKAGGWLGLQTLGVAGFAGRAWQITGAIQEAGKEWQAARDFQGEFPPVTVIVPARNEERGIEPCVRSLLAQDYPDFELIVVDDASQDATPQILEAIGRQDRRLKVIRLDEELPPGWAGKPRALNNGYAAARPASRWLLFTDADTLHQPQALRLAVGAALTEGVDLLSILTELELKTFWERVAMPLAIMGIMLQYPVEAVNRPGSKIAIANGQFVLIRRETYERVGGYAGRLKGSLLDDRDLALAVKTSGGRLRLKNGQPLVRVRMYTGLAEIWQGFRKNAFVGSRAAYLSVPLLVISGLWLGVLPFVQLPWALARLLQSQGRQGRRLLAASLLQTGLIVLTRRRFDRRLNVPPLYAFSSPLSSLVMCGVLIDSAIRSLAGRGVTWKGRRYAGAARTQQLIK